MVDLPRTLDLTAEFPPLDTADWRALVERDLRGAPFEKKLITHTYEGIRVEPLYTADHATGIAERTGSFPYTRGATTQSEPDRAWDLRQERAEPLPNDLNAAILADLEQGVTSVTIRVDAAGRQGLDPDDAEAARLVGTDGASLATLDCWRRAFEGVHLEMIGVALEAGAAFDAGAAMVAALWNDKGVKADQCRGAFNADPLAVLARDGRLPGSLDNAMKRAGELAAWTKANYPHVTSIRVGSAPYHHAGATAAQDLAFSIATGIEYLRTLASAGLSPTDANRQMVFSSAVGCHFFLASSKLRAARRLWARVLEASGVDPAEATMRTHVRTSKRVLTDRDPWVNLLRNTASVFAAAVGGADVVTSASFDQARGLPSARGARLARHTATILTEEAHLLRVADPAGGSWYLEKLTDELCEKAWPIVRAIESRGGMAKALAGGFVHEQLDAALDERTRRLSTRKAALVGISEFPNPTEQHLEHPTASPASVLGAARRDVLEHREIAAQDAFTAAGMDAMVEGAGAGVTLGRLAQAVFEGEPETIDRPVIPHPYAEAFEALRDAVDEHEHAMGLRPRACLVQLGTLAECSARAGFATGLLEAGGFEIVSTDPAEDIAALAKTFAESGASIAVICSTDKRYESSLDDLARALHRAGARTVVLAGNPGKNEADYRAAGVDRFIFIKCDVLQTLRELLSEEGVTL